MNLDQAPTQELTLETPEQVKSRISPKLDPDAEAAKALADAEKYNLPEYKPSNIIAIPQNQIDEISTPRSPKEISERIELLTSDLLTDSESRQFNAIIADFFKQYNPVAPESEEEEQKKKAEFLKGANPELWAKSIKAKESWKKMTELELLREGLNIKEKTKTTKPMPEEELSRLVERMSRHPHSEDTGISGESFLVQAKLTLEDPSLSEEQKILRLAKLKRVVGGYNGSYLDTYQDGVLGMSAEQKNMLELAKLK